MAKNYPFLLLPIRLHKYLSRFKQQLFLTFQSTWTLATYLRTVQPSPSPFRPQQVPQEPGKSKSPKSAATILTGESDPKRYRYLKQRS